MKSKMKEIDCTVIGDAMIDITLPLSNVNSFDHLLQEGLTNTAYTISPGGVANVAADISKLGGKPAFIGKVGDDYFGRLFIEDLDRNKVIQKVSVSKTKNTGVVFNLVFPDGERFFIVDRGANAILEYSDISFGLIEKSKFLYFAGFSFQDEEPFQAIQRILKKVPKKDITIVFNLGAPNLAKKFKNLFIEVIREYVGILILNEKEGEYLADSSKDNEIINFLLPDVEIVILTKGEKGSIIATRDNIYNIKACPVKAIDTTGAGDAYAAAFIYGLSKGWREDKAGKFAAKIAGRVVGWVGANIKIT